MPKTNNGEPGPIPENKQSGSTQDDQDSKRSDASRGQEVLDPADPEDLLASVPEELLEALESGDKKKLAATLQLVAAYYGPLPPPDMLREYNDALTDGANRIVSNWESESRHRRTIERRSQNLAFIIVMSAIVAAVGCAYFGQPWIGFGIVLATMLGIGLAGALKFIGFKRPAR